MLRQLAAIAALITLSACATPYVATPYERTQHNIRQVSLIDDSLPEDAIAFEVASVGSNFGLIGALVDAGIQASRRNAVNEALDSVSFDAETMLEQRLSSSLANLGYSVAPLTENTRTKYDFLKEYPDSATADALLDVAVQHYGYLSSGAGQPFRPSVAAKVRLVKASDKSTIMENIIYYNVLHAPDGTITLPPNPEYEFQNRDALLEDPQRLADGISDALNQVVATTVRLLQ
ncbi:hypothetical protein [Brevundimonas pishanensis]|uniref:hypothetical protein n=1 Tax=Brevundimonas pishanensis TaxID=2896315 RepID=UPI001FA6EA22|nr:hypothetical protein [Brevundimonas pishanensis]